MCVDRVRAKVPRKSACVGSSGGGGVAELELEPEFELGLSFPYVVDDDGCGGNFPGGICAAIPLARTPVESMRARARARSFFPRYFA